MKNFNTIKSKVKQILTNQPQTRDDNSILIHWYYVKYCKLSATASYIDFIALLINKKIPSIETLARLSRQVQEQNIELRGEKREHRKNVKTEIVKSDLGYGKH